MSARVLLRIWIALAVVPLVAGAAYAAEGRTFVCQGDEVVRRDCCCPGHEHQVGAASAATPELKAACCCDISQMSSPAAAPAAEPRVAASVAPLKVFPAAVSLALVEPSLATTPWWLVVRTAHPPPPAVPILLQKQSLLI
jgi:hypothetical protein